MNIGTTCHRNIKTYAQKIRKTIGNLLNASSKDNKKKCAVDINDMYIFFKYVNEIDSDEPHYQDTDYSTTTAAEVIELSEGFLNSGISENDITEAVRKIKTANPLDLTAY